MQHMLDLMKQVAPTRLSVLITGETGTGKELVARGIHNLSARARGPYVAVNCGAIPDTLLDAELFGYTRGSFTGALATRRGLVEEAQGGSLFVDEISTLTPQTQIALLRVIEERSIRKVGSNHAQPVDFRLIAATNEDLQQKVARGQFREDLYFRLRVFPIALPPLRDRREDIPLLAEHFRRSFAQENDVVPPPFSEHMLQNLQAMEWPGNVRELKHFVQRAIVLRLGATDVRCVGPLQCPPGPTNLVRRALGSEWTLKQLEKEYIRAVLEKTKGNQSRAAAILGVDRRTLYRYLHPADDGEADPPDPMVL